MTRSRPAPGDAVLHADALAHHGELVCTAGWVADGTAALKSALTLWQRFEYPPEPSGRGDPARPIEVLLASETIESFQRAPALPAIAAHVGFRRPTALFTTAGPGVRPRGGSDGKNMVDESR